MPKVDWRMKPTLSSVNFKRDRVKEAKSQKPETRLIIWIEGSDPSIKQRMNLGREIQPWAKIQIGEIHD